MGIAQLLRPRSLFLAIFAGCAGLIAFGMYLQHALDLQPCPMCILQRYAFVVAGIIALVAAAHGPARLGNRIYGTLVALVALAGGGVATWQTWLIHNPPPVAECGPGLEFMVQQFPLTEALPMIFQGSGDCAKVQWSFLGLAIAEWALVAFTGIVIAAVIAVVMAGRRPLHRA
jgi:disulfide bond formation protein DsbB